MKIVSRIKKTGVLTLLAAVAGVVIGALEAGFGKGLDFITGVRGAHLYLFLPLLPLGGLAIILVFDRFGRDAAGGMGLMFEAWKDRRDKVPLRLIPLMIGSAWVTHLFGGSAGREGVAVQVGAAVAHRAGRLAKYGDAPKLLMVAGMAAGFAGLFQTPIAALLFAMEVLVVGEMRYEAFMPTIAAAGTSYVTAGLLGMRKEAHLIAAVAPAGGESALGAFSPAALSQGLVSGGTAGEELLFLVKIVGCAVAFGLAGLAFSMLVRRGRAAVKKILPQPYVRMAVLGVVLAGIMLISGGRYSGSGANLIDACFEGGDIYWYDWLLKLTLTGLTLIAGFVGGEVMPLFTVGATLGFVLGGLLGLPPQLMAALGVAGVFCSGTGTFFAAAAIGGELFGWGFMPLILLVCIFAKISNPVGTVYAGQERLGQ